MLQLCTQNPNIEWSLMFTFQLTFVTFYWIFKYRNWISITSLLKREIICEMPTTFWINLMLRNEMKTTFLLFTWTLQCKMSLILWVKIFLTWLINFVYSSFGIVGNGNGKLSSNSEPVCCCYYHIYI